VAAASELGAHPPAAPAPAAVTEAGEIVGAGARPVGPNGSHRNGGPGDPADATASGGTDAGTTDPPDAGTRARRRPDPVALAAAALVLIPSIVAAVSALRHPWIPTNDWALLELRVREVGTGDTPLLGPWSRFGWKHPGPLMFYVLALPYRLVPADHGLLFATACVNLAATIGFALVVLRYPRTRAVVALFGLAMLQRGMGIDQLSDPWNPTILIVPFALYLVLCLEITTGRGRWPVPVAAGVATFVVQSHVGLAQPVLLLGAVAFALRWYLARRDTADARAAAAAASTATAGPSGEAMPPAAGSSGEVALPGPPGRSGPSGEVGASGEVGPPARPSRPGWRRVPGGRVPWRRLTPTALVLGVLWLPPAIDQVNGTGNLGLLLRWARGEDIGGGMGALTEGRLGGERILEGASWLLNPLGLWVGRFQPLHVYGSPLLGHGRPLSLLWVPLALGLALVAARRAPLDDAYRRPTAVAGILAATGVVGLFIDLFAAEGAAVFWPFRWAAVVVMLIFVSLGWAVAGVAVRRFPWLDQELPARVGSARAGSGAGAEGAVAGVDGVGPGRRWARSARGPSGGVALPARMAGAGMVAAVALPVALAAWRGPVGRQPVQPASEALLRLRPAIEESARAEPFVVANTVDFLNDKDVGVPVILERAGIDWVGLTDPRGVGHYRYLVFPVAALQNPYFAAALHEGKGELLARSGPPAETELVLLRARVEELPPPR
jgi:hypothetical protein